MFSPVNKSDTSLTTLQIDNKEYRVPKGISVAAAILGYAREESCRTSFITGEKRAPFCFMGVCHDCLVEIDGRPNQQGCVVQVQEGMQIRRQNISEALVDGGRQ